MGGAKPSEAARRLNMLVSKNSLDVSRIFLAYTAFQGDAAKTAFALEIPVETVKDLSRRENWDDKLKSLNGGTADVKEQAIGVNRAVNFVQAHRTRAVLDRILSELFAKEGHELIDLLTVSTQNGSEVKMRPITDLVKAIETAQLMTARALGDTAEERPKGEDGVAGSDIALQVQKAMAAADQIGIDSVTVVRKQLAAETGPKV